MDIQGAAAELHTPPPRVDFVAQISENTEKQLQDIEWRTDQVQVAHTAEFLGSVGQDQVYFCSVHSQHESDLLIRIVVFCNTDRVAQ